MWESIGAAGGEEGTQRRRTLPRLQRIPEMLPHRQHLRIGADVVEMGAVTGERRRAKVGGNVKSTGPTPLPPLRRWADRLTGDGSRKLRTLPRITIWAQYCP